MDEENVVPLPFGADPNEQHTKNFVWSTRDCLGQGGFGVVYKGHDRRNKQRKVAVKVNHPAEKDYIENFSVLAKLNSPYIIKYIAEEEVIGSRDKALIMEFGDGSVFDELKKPKNRLGLHKDVFLKLLDHCVSALLYLDEKRIAHRDIKPNNILVQWQPELRFKIGDFGLSCQLRDRNQTLHTPVGAQPYMPSVLIYAAALGENVTKYTKDELDLWSAACCFFECATGRLPFRVTVSFHLDSQFYEAMNEIYEERPDDAVCADYDNIQQKPIYRTHMPLQHPSYSRGFQSVLNIFFRNLFSRRREFLNMKKFHSLYTEMRSLIPFKYYFFNASCYNEYYVNCNDRRRSSDPLAPADGKWDTLPTYFPRPTFENAVKDDWNCIIMEPRDEHERIRSFDEPLVLPQVLPRNGSSNICSQAFQPNGEESKCIVALLPDAYELVLYEELGMAVKLVEKNGPVDSEILAGATVLHVACQEGYTPIVEHLVDKEGADINAKDYFCQATPLICAIIKGQYDIAKLLIERGADVNAADVDDDTALHLALYKRIFAGLDDCKVRCSTQLVDIARLLLEKDVGIDACNKNGLTPVMIIDIANDPENDLFPLLLMGGAKVNPVVAAAVEKQKRQEEKIRKAAEQIRAQFFNGKQDVDFRSRQVRHLLQTLLEESYQPHELISGMDDLWNKRIKCSAPEKAVITKAFGSRLVALNGKQKRSAGRRG